MDFFLQALYEQYDILLKARERINNNIVKIVELIKDNGGEVSDGKQSYTSALFYVSDDVALKASVETLIQKPYNEKWNWQAKVVYALNLLGKPSTSKEIAIEIRELEPHTDKSVEKSVELTASRMYRDNLLNAKKEGVKNFYSLKS